MPLIQGRSKKSFSKNVKAEMDNGKSQPQSLAIAYSIKKKNSKKKMAEGGEVDISASDEKRSMPDDVHGDSHEVSRSKKKGASPEEWIDGDHRSQAAGEGSKEKNEVDEDFVNEVRAKADNSRTAEEMRMKRESSDPKHVNEDHEIDIADARLAKGGEVEDENFSDERRANSENANSFREMNMKKGSSSDPLDINSDHDMDIEDARLAKGGKVQNPKLAESKKSADDHYSSIADAILAKKRMADGGMIDAEEMDEDQEGEDRDNSVADKIMAKKRMADGGQVDLEENSEESPNEEDQMSFEANGKEQYDLSQLDEQPEDSNEHGHELLDEDSHDMVEKIRRKIKAKRGE